MYCVKTFLPMMLQQSEECHYVSVYLPGLVSTDIGECERNYPADATDQPKDSPERQAMIENFRKWFQRGISIDEAADILFAGLRENKLYIGPRDFLKKHPNLIDMIRSRGENIINENSAAPYEIKVTGDR